MVSSRRFFCLSVASATLVGGCFGRPERTRLDEIQFVNEGDAARTFEVTIEADGEEVYAETRTVSPAEDEPIPVVTEGLPDARGPLTVRTTVGDAAASHTYEAGRCFGLLVEYSPGTVVYFSNDRRCAGTPSRGRSGR
ncbi:hypothetical protein C475_20537 [Halosimplex carlsbadense 2-9-1]|uniref:Lipoprotein n=1 Tax=Halosimplex carlsbadense 2-9-1 TaxID=797114 RepID=M0CE87_9EURY|nr:hypothetical protein [Halosimplex carlsbadense]ELZ20199.1 hypothetical protein C475_20537 [Halosimplex carlsbadense 2-9-1]